MEWRLVKVYECPECGELVRDMDDACNHTCDRAFTKEEWKELVSIRQVSGLNWHDFIVEAAKDWMRCEKEGNY